MSIEDLLANSDRYVFWRNAMLEDGDILADAIAAGIKASCAERGVSKPEAIDYDNGLDDARHKVLLALKTDV